LECNSKQPWKKKQFHAAKIIHFGGFKLNLLFQKHFWKNYFLNFFLYFKLIFFLCIFISCMYLYKK
jgi:hypothetical protein